MDVSTVANSRPSHGMCLLVVVRIVHEFHCVCVGAVTLSTVVIDPTKDCHVSIVSVEANIISLLSKACQQHSEKQLPYKARGPITCFIISSTSINN